MSIIFNKYQPDKSIYYIASIIIKYFHETKGQWLVGEILEYFENQLKVNGNIIILSLEWLILINAIKFSKRDEKNYVFI